MIAYQGSPLAAPVPASTRRETSVAVSNPSPNKMPTGYIWPGRVMVLVSRPRMRFMKPRFCRWVSS